MTEKHCSGSVNGTRNTVKLTVRWTNVHNGMAMDEHCTVTVAILILKHSCVFTIIIVKDKKVLYHIKTGRGN